jgi:hypothetical protein
MIDQLVAEAAAYTTQKQRDENACRQRDSIPEIQATEWLQTYAFACSATGIG